MDIVERLEFRPDERGDFDEIVARFADGMVHVETMSDQGCYVGFYWDDGRYCQWWIGCTGRGKLTYSHEDGHHTSKHKSGYGDSEALRRSLVLTTALDAIAKDARTALETPEDSNDR